MTAHHNDFEYMIWKMEHGDGAKPNNNFGISNDAKYGDLEDMETEYEEYPLFYNGCTRDDCELPVLPE